MNTTFLTSINFHGQKIIPSDVFELGGNRYLLLDISRSSTTNDVNLHIIGLKGTHLGREFNLPLDDLASNPNSLLNF